MSVSSRQDRHGRGGYISMVRSLRLGVSAAGLLAAGAALAPATAATFDLAGANTTFAGLLGSDTYINSGGALDLTLDFPGNALFTGLVDDSAGGAIRLIKTGTGNQNLFSANNYRGGTQLQNGTLRFGNALSFGSGALTFTGGGVLTPSANGITIANAIVLQADGTIATGGVNTGVSGLISGAGQLFKEGTGVLTLSNPNNTYTGGTVIQQGGIHVGGDGSLGTGAVTVGPINAILGVANLNSSVTLGNDILLLNQLNIELPNAGQSITLTGAISGSQRFFLKQGGGTLILPNATTNTGNTLVASGYLGVGNNNSISSGTGQVFASGESGIAAYAAGLTLANRINAGALFHFDTRGFDLTQAGVITNRTGFVGSLAKDGAGRLTLGAANTYTGGTTVNAGELAITGTTSPSSLVTVNAGATLSGTGSANGLVNVNNGAILSPGIGGAGTLGVGSLSLASSSILNFDLGAASDLVNVGSGLTLDGTLNINPLAGFGVGTYRLFNYSAGFADNTLDFGTTPAGFSYSLDTATSGQVNLIVASLSDFTYWDGANLVANGAIDGGSGTWNAANTNWTEATGTSNAAWSGVTANFGVAAGTVTVAGVQAVSQLNFTVDGYVLQGDGLDAATGVAIDTTVGTTTINSVISGTTVEKTGAGTLVLGGVNTYAGGTTVTAGTLGLGNAAAVGSGAVTLLGTLRFDAAGIDLANDITLVGLPFVIASTGGSQISGVISGAGNLNILGGDLTLSGINTFTGGTVLQNNTTLTISSDANLGAALPNGIFIAGDNTLRLDGAISSARALQAEGGIWTIDTMTGDDVLTGSIVNTFGDSTVNKTGAARLTLTGINDNRGGTIISQGVLSIADDRNLGAVTGPLNFQGTGDSTLEITSSITSTRPVLLTAAAAFDTVGAATTATFDGAFSGAGSLTKVGDGTLVLGGTNSYTGLTLVNAGTLTLQGGAAIADTGAVQIDGGTLNVDTAETIGALVANGGTTNVNADLSAGALSGTAGSIVLNGPAGIVAGSANTSTAFGGVLSGSGYLQKVGAGALTLTNASTFQGGTTVSGGTLALTGAGAISGPSFTIDPGATLTTDGGALTIAASIRNDGAFALTDGGSESIANIFFGGTIALSSGSVLTLNAGASPISGVVSGDGGLTVSGSSVTTLTAANTYAGGTVIDTGGTLIVQADSGLGATTGGLAFNAGGATLVTTGNVVSARGVTLNAGGTIDTQGNDSTFSGVVSGVGALTKAGPGRLTLSGANTYSGGTSLDAGTLGAGSNTALGTGTLAMTGGTTLQAAAGGLTLANAIDLGGNGIIDTQAFEFALSGTLAAGEGGGITKIGNGTLTLSGASTYTGATNVDAGTLSVTGSLGNTATTVASGATLQGTGSIAGPVTIADGGAIGAGVGAVGTLTVGALTLNDASIVNFELGAANTIGGPLNDQIIVTGNLVLDGNLNVTTSAGGTFGLGIYNLFSYGTVTDNGLVVSALPGGFSGIIQDQTAAKQINLIVAASGTLVQYWDGTDFVGNGAIDGGNGSWTTAATNWTGPAPSAINTNWQPNSIGVFQGAAGNVSVVNDFTFQGLQFSVNGYNLTAGGGSLVTDTASFLFVDTGLAATITAPINGAGAILKQGGGNLILGGTNGYAGGTDLQAGTIGVLTDAALGTGQLSMANGTALRADAAVTLANAVSLSGTSFIRTPNFDLTLDGVVSGSGTLTKQGAETLTLNGVNTYSGGTDLQAGTIVIGTDSALGTGQLTMSDGTILAAGVSGLVVANSMSTLGGGRIDSGPGVLTLNGNIGGAGSISQIGTGNMVLNGNNSFNGLGINQGTVTVGSNTAAGASFIALNDGAILAAGVSGLVLANTIETTGGGRIDSGPGIFTLNGDISGAGSISQIGTGNLVLNGNNSFNGLGINQGIVTVGSNTAAGASFIALNDGAILAAGVSGLVLANTIETTGGGRIDSGPGIFTLNGDIGGAGSISQIGTGNLVLNGNNSFNGLGINQGTVTVGSNTAAGASFIALNDGAILAAGVSGLVLANAIETTGGGRIDSGSGIFTLNGQISGAGSISQIGTGNLVLNGNNSFTGGLGINQGTVTVGTNTAAGLSFIALNNGGILAAGVSGLVLSNTIETTGGGRIDSGAGVFTLDGDISGVGSISQIGTGNLVLNGNNSFTGGLGINQGTVTLGTAASAGLGFIALNDGGILAAGVSGLVLTNGIQTTGGGRIDSGPGVFTINSTISGVGSISQIGTGNLVLNGNNTFAGGLGINQGTVTVGTNTAAGTSFIALNDGAILAAGVSGLVLANNIDTTGGGRIDSGPGVFTLNGVIAGAGSISQIGTGNLVLNGNNSFAGGLGINQGTVTVGSNTAAGSSFIALNDGAILAAGVSGLVLANTIDTTGGGRVDSGPGVFTLNGVIGGAGSISQVGAGNLVLNGNNSFTGGLGINRGTVTLGSNTAGGRSFIAINDGATLAAGVTGLTVANAIDTTAAGRIDSGSGVFTLSGTIGGTGSITKVGSGNLVLTGVSTLAGPTTVAAGRLTVDGSLAASPTTVQSGASLAGIGTVGTLTVQSGGTVAPAGAGIGTLSVAGGVTFASGANFLVDLGATGDRLSATGPASLNGTVTFNLVGPTYLTNSAYTVLSSSARSGTFATVASGNFGNAFLTSVTYDATSVFVRLTPNSLVTLGGTGLTPNQLAVASAFDRATAGGYNPVPFYSLYGLGAGTAGALSQLSGELHAAERRVALDDTRVVRETAFDRLNAGLEALSGAGVQTATTDSGDAQTTVWLRGAGSWGTADSDGIGSRFETKQAGVLTGVDYATGEWKVGAAFTYIHNDLELNTLGKSKVESTGGALYAGYRVENGFAVGVGGSVASVSAKGSRSISIPGLGQTLTSNTKGTVYQAFGEVAYDLSAAQGTRIEPFARFAYAKYDAKAFNEAGGVAAVSGAKQSYDQSIATAGLRGSFDVGMATLSGSVGYQHIGGDRSPVAVLTIAGVNQPMAIRSVELDKDAAAIEAQASFRIGKSATLGVGYSGVIGSNNTDHGARATLTFGF